MKKKRSIDIPIRLFISLDIRKIFKGKGLFEFNSILKIRRLLR